MCSLPPPLCQISTPPPPRPLCLNRQVTCPCHPQPALILTLSLSRHHLLCLQYLSALSLFQPLSSTKQPAPFPQPPPPAPLPAPYAAQPLSLPQHSFNPILRHVPSLFPPLQGPTPLLSWQILRELPCLQPWISTPSSKYVSSRQSLPPPLHRITRLIHSSSPFQTRGYQQLLASLGLLPPSGRQ